MSNFALARALTTGVTVAALTTGIVTVSVAACAHGTGGQTGGGGPKGMATMTTGKMTTTKTSQQPVAAARICRPGLCGLVIWLRLQANCLGCDKGLWRYLLISGRDNARLAPKGGLKGPPFGLRGTDPRNPIGAGSRLGSSKPHRRFLFVSLQDELR